MIDRQHLLHIAKLARLKLSQEELETFTVSLGSILNYVEQLNSVETDNIEPTCFIAPEHDPLRDDIEAQSLTSDMLLQNGPDVNNNYFAVPKIIDY
ncbi:MAG TPA: Asp-tRNA(Asn)/Glu-tRNA(Gln) amidotransferase subunit GatC [Chitinispirillaceae bacterium]|jgi:aspartyl-tRNA(Asn)/glutamyl-tRNA(Gln) amidotransferase subunit C|nr:Asp-tRNA(Asn)/Glu-tRNA(Gln) amidotransferase subunit GatC [Chitinispirillaceae bacterium]